jgi:hypothetical protein
MLTSEPALTFPRIIVGQKHCGTSAPACAQSFAHFQTDARSADDVANVTGLPAMLSHNPELRANTSVAYRVAPWLSGTAAYGFE